MFFLNDVRKNCQNDSQSQGLPQNLLGNNVTATLSSPCKPDKKGSCNQRSKRHLNSNQNNKSYLLCYQFVSHCFASDPPTNSDEEADFLTLLNLINNVYKDIDNLCLDSYFRRKNKSRMFFSISYTTVTSSFAFSADFNQ